MAKGEKDQNAISKNVRKHATLDNWVGHMAHIGDGASTDPKMRDMYKVAKGPKHQSGEEHQTPII